MNPTEAAELLGHAAAFDNRNPSAAAAVAWAAALEDMPLDADAKAAVALYYRTPSQNPNDRLWILPHHIRSLRSKIRSARLENFQYEPLPDETVPEYLVRYQGQVQAIASGRVAAPSGRLELEGGADAFMRELEARGMSFAGEASDDEPAQAELLDSVRRSGPLGIECPACRAAIGKPCKTPGGTDRQPLGKPRLKPHTARLRAASGESEAATEERAAGERRIRQMSAQHLAREAEGIPDAVIVDEGAAS